MMNYIISIIIFFILIVVQFVIPKYMPFNLWTLYPNFILMFVAYTALNKGIMRGQITGFVYGLTWDVLSTDIFGVRALSFTIAGYLAGSFNKKLNKNQPLTQIIVMSIGLVITQLILNITYILPKLEHVNISFIHNKLQYSLYKIIATNAIKKMIDYNSIISLILSLLDKYNLILSGSAFLLTL